MEKYERLEVTVTTFDAEDVITTSGGEPSTIYNPENSIHADYGSDLPVGSSWGFE